MEEKTDKFKPTQIQKEVSIKMLEVRAAKIEDMPCFRRIPVTEFDKEHLVMLCQLFAEEWQKTQEQYYEVLQGAIPICLKARAKAVTKVPSKPSFWRGIWHRRPGGLFWFLCMVWVVVVFVFWLVRVFC